MKTTPKATLAKAVNVLEALVEKRKAQIKRYEGVENPQVCAMRANYQAELFLANDILFAIRDGDFSGIEFLSRTTP